MKILHTSDWHLGAGLQGFGRIDEQRTVLDEIYRIATGQDVDIVLIAGDVYDTYNPPAEAEELFLSTMDRFSHAGVPCVVIAGNHDSPDKLCAPGALAGSRGIYILGKPGDTPAGVGIVEAAPNYLRIKGRHGDAMCGIAALPYPSPGRIKAEEGEYAAAIGELFKEAASHFHAEDVNIAMTHLYAVGGEAGTTERPIEGVGGALCVPATMLCPEAQYVALGHLHRPQRPIAGRLYYSGSILKQDFSECDQIKRVLLIETEPGGEPVVTDIPLVSGRNLVRWRVDSLDEAMQRIEDGQDALAWVEITIATDTAIGETDIRRLRQMRDRIVAIRIAARAEVGAQPIIDWQRQSPEKLFKSFYMQQKGVEPARSITGLFLDLMNAQGGESDAAADIDV